jgi:GDP-D-mannose dehydratase
MTLKSKKVFITGISGFAGAYVAKYLLKQGAKVSGLVRRRERRAVVTGLKAS